MTSVTGLDGSVTRYEYDALGRRILTAGGSLTTEYEYDAVGSVVRMATTGETGLELLYSYDLNGMLTSETRSENGVSTVSEYAYDALNRVSAYTNGSQSESYSYDAVGNMLEKLANGTAITMTYDAANRMTGMSSENGSISYTYSANGDLISKAMGGLRDTYTYDAAGNLTQYSGYDGYEVNYTYSALNLLTEKVSKGSSDRATLEEIVSGKGSANTAAGKETVTTRYTYDILQTYANVLTETANGETTSYEYGLERIAAYTGTDAEQVKTQYVYDVRGSVIETVTARALRELSGATAAPTVTVQGYAYTPYGEQTGTDVSGYTYNGEYYDAATGMLNLRARQYEPAQMRFSRPDIVRGYAVNPQSINRYAYCVNNPVMYADPSGEVVASAMTNKAIMSVALGEDGPIYGKVDRSVNKVVQKKKSTTQKFDESLKLLEPDAAAKAMDAISRLDTNMDPTIYDLACNLIIQKAACRTEGSKWDGWVNQPFNLILTSGIEQDINFLLSETSLLVDVSFEQRYELLIKLYIGNEDYTVLTAEDMIECGLVDEEERYYYSSWDFLHLFEKDAAESKLIDIITAYKCSKENTSIEGLNALYWQELNEEQKNFLYGSASRLALNITQTNLASGRAIPNGTIDEFKPFDYTDTKYEDKSISGLGSKNEAYVKKRNWNMDLINNTYNYPYTTRQSINRTDNFHPATVYYNKDGDYIIVDDVTNELVQLSEYGNTAWQPDRDIINPYIP